MENIIDDLSCYIHIHPLVARGRSSK